MLERLARFCFRRHRLIAVVWIAILIALGAGSGALGANFRTEFQLPDTESRRGFDILDKGFGGAGAGMGGSVVFRTDGSIDDPAAVAKIAAVATAIRALPAGLTVQSPFEPGGESQVARQGPLANKLAYITASFTGEVDQAAALKVSNQIQDIVEPIEGLQTEIGGEIFAEFAPPSSETLGLAFAIFILLLAFGSVLAMGLPVGVALAGIFAGVTLTTLLTHVAKIPDFAPTLGVMIGLGVGIDYALFIVTRYREGLHQGLDPEEATVVAYGTAGRAVVFAGITVMISLLGMLIMGLSFINGLAIGASLAVLTTLIASLTLLPALLGFARHKVEITRWRGLIAICLVAVAMLMVGIKQPVLALPFVGLAIATLAASFFVPVLRGEVPRRAVKPTAETFWYRWSRVVQHRPWRAALGGLVTLLILTIPLFSLRLGFGDEGNFPTDTTTRRAYDLLASGFGPGFNGPLVLAAEVPTGASLEAFTDITDAIAADPGVAFASPAIANNPDNPTAILWRVIPRTSPQDAATTELVHRLRDNVLPAATQGGGIDVAVAGTVAANIDFSDYLSGRLLYFYGAVLALSFLLLMAVFRSVLVPLKAVVMNLLSIGAAYGVIVAVFQWGWFSSLVGVGKGAPIEPFMPMMLFAIVFGLSMDYEVFLLSRIKEEYDRTGDNASAVADGLATTARVITAAAAIMVFVFGSFLLESNRIIKLFGMGLAVAVLLDATIVRMVLVPATMELLGRRNWWLPAWLDRLLPRINVEGKHSTTAPLIPVTADI